MSLLCSVLFIYLFKCLESSDESSLATSPLRHRLPQSMKIVHEIMYKVEVLYVLCVLLMGRQRNQVLFLFVFCLEVSTCCASARLGFVSHLCIVVSCRSTRCWLSSASSRVSITCLTNSSGGNTRPPITWCTARTKTATVVQYELFKYQLLFSINNKKKPY